MIRYAIAGAITFAGAACFAFTCWWVMVTIGPHVPMPRWCFTSLMLSTWAIVGGVTVMKVHADD